jgi:O-antigen/teichoic acid export membrane protein
VQPISHEREAKNGLSLPSLRLGHGAAGAVVQTVAARGLIVVLNIGTGVITARALGANGRGILAALVMWPQVAAWFASCGLTVSLLYNMNARRSDRSGLFAASLVLMSGAGCVAAAIGCSIMSRLLANYHPADIRFAQLLLVTTPLVSIGLVLQATAEAERDFAAANILRVVPATGVFFAMLALFSLGLLTPHIGALVYALASLPMAAWLFGRLTLKLRPSFIGTRRAARALISYGLRCYPNDLLSAAAVNVGPIVVIGMLDPASVGYFAVSLSLSRVLDVLNSSVATVLLPSIAAQDQIQVMRKATVAARLNLLTTSLAALPLLALAPFLLPLVYGADFSAAGLIAQLLLVEMTLTGTSAILSQAFIALGRPGIVTLLQAAGFGLSTSLLLWLAPRFGAAGAAACMLAAALTKLICIIACYKAVLGLPLSELRFRRDDFAWLRGAFRHRAMAS